MKKFYKGLGIVLLILVALFYYACVPDRWSWNQKVSLIVETPGGELSASAVTKVVVSRLDKPWVFIEARGANTKVTGEAVALEVSPGKYIFALLKGARHEGNAHSLVNVFRDKSRKETSGQFWSRIDHSRLSTKLPEKRLPLLVTFADINDPASVVRVDPYDLETHFGAGVTLKAVTLEITSEPVTLGAVVKVLGWWNNLKVPIGGES